MAEGWKLMHHKVSLFAAEFIQGLGHVLSMKWVIEGQVNTGTFCTTQGILIIWLTRIVRDTFSDSYFRYSETTGRNGGSLGYSGKLFELDPTSRSLII